MKRYPYIICAPTQELLNVTSNLSLGYNQVYCTLNTTILEKVLKEVLKVRNRIIYISRVKSYDCPKIVSYIHKCFHFKWNKFCPKNYQILKFCIVFRTNSQEILMQKKLKNLVRLTYISHMYEIL